MLAKDFITKELPVLKSFDTVEYALGLMDDFKLKHLPLLKDGIYQCLIAEKDLHMRIEPTDEIGEPVLFAPSIKASSHLHEAMALLTRYQLSILPVVNTDGIYLGAITREKLVDILTEFCSAEATGSLIVLELLPQDYVLTDIARIIESNNGHVLSLLSHIDQASGRLNLVIKIDLDDASPVIRSFERFNYTVLYYFMEHGLVDDVLQHRMDELLHYMNI